MNLNLFRSERSLSILALFALTSLSQACPAIAQNTGETPKQAVNAKLAKTVHLTLGATTVYKLMAALSDQTGLSIRAADYLRERRIIVQMENVSAESALNDISELNDWSWSETGQDQILVTRKQLHVPASPDAIPRQFQAAIPRDLRTYLAAATPSENMTPRPSGQDHKAAGARMRVFGTLMRTVPTEQRAFLLSLPQEIRNGESIPYLKLTPLQRSQLLITLVFPLFQEIGSQLLYSDSLPQVTSVNEAVLKLTGNSLDVKTLVNDGAADTSIGFGAPFQ